MQCARAIFKFCKQIAAGEVIRREMLLFSNDLVQIHTYTHARYLSSVAHSECVLKKYQSQVYVARRWKLNIVNS